MPAPLAVFAFNRPDHLRRTLAALAANDLAAESELTVFCDGPRREEERALTEEVRTAARAASGFKSLTVIAQDANQGLAASVISGVTRLVERYGTVIVVEDDLLTSPYFLRYLNDGLELYADNPKVASIHGYCFPHSVKNAPATFFLKGADCWGWATWKRAWDLFEPDALASLMRIREKGETLAFNRNMNYDYTGMLQDAAAGRVSSWAVRWLASTWLQDMFTLYPGQSLVFHAGADGSGTHYCGIDTREDVPLAEQPVRVYPIEVAEDPVMAREWRVFLRTLSGGPAKILLIRALKRFPPLYARLRALKLRLSKARAD